MKIPGHNNLDSRLTLLPNAYLANPVAFGSDVKIKSLIPPGGTEASRRVALHQHYLAVRLSRIPMEQRLSTAGIIGHFDISKQSWSRILRGETWARQTGLTALDLAISYRPKNQPVL